VLRHKIDDVFATDPNVRLVVLGDFNDTPEAKSTRTITGRGKHKLLDTRPSEQNGDDPSSVSTHNHSPRSIAWTHFYAVQDTYSRIDYILLSPALTRSWLTNQTFVLATRNWGQASDHRPILATFDTDK
jgi:endonuclease/exonuclease/phosphatase family metal-dependent hydrolase